MAGSMDGVCSRAFWTSPDAARGEAVNTRPIATWAGFGIGLAGLTLQFSISIPARMATGDNLGGALVYFFTFFTILTNLMLVLIYLSDLVAPRWLGWWRSPVTRAMMAAAILVVMLFYHFLLAGLWQPQGLFLVCDVTLHYVCPIVFILWWLFVTPHVGLKIDNIPPMLLPPVIYVVYAMIRGAIVGEYPYPVLEANKLGYLQVAINIGALLVFFVLLCALAVWIDGLLARRKT